MNFFEKLSELIDGYTVQLTVRLNDDGEMTVMVVPMLNKAKEEVQNTIQPLMLTGKPEDIDVGFFAAISEGLRKASILQSNVIAFQKSLDEASKKLNDKKGSKSSSKETAKAEKDTPKLEFGKEAEAEKKPEEPKENKEAKEEKPAEEKKPVPGGNPGNVFKKKVEEPAKEAETEKAVEQPVQDSGEDGFGDEDW